MPKINFNDFQNATNEKYGDFEVHLPNGDIALFVPAIRMAKEQRKALAKTLDIQTRAKEAAESDADTDIYDLYREAFQVSEKVPGHFDKLAAVVGDDPATWQGLFIEFQEITQAGEA